MIGDAPGDYKAARSTTRYSIRSFRREEASWEHFFHEALDRFFAGSYAGEYEAQLLKEFDACLPEKPTW
jgi:hypothetical protein